MATLQIKTAGLENPALELRPGVNRVGRSPDSDFVIEHDTISTNHCEFILSADGVFLRDCDSTNGCFVNGSPVKEARLKAGQMVALGDVELYVASTEAPVIIPEFERPRPKPPVVLPDGAMICPRHAQMQAKFKCTHCREIMCEECVHVLRRKGGNPLLLCPLCSHKCERIQTVTEKKKRSFVEFLQDTVKLRFRDPITDKTPKK